MDDDGLDWQVVRGAGFNAHVGPVHFATAGEGLWYAVLDLDERHINAGGVCHGGVLLTLADTAMGAAAYRAGGRRACATIGLSSSFVAAAKIGQELRAEARLDRLAGGLAFMQCELSAGGRLCMRASGIWKFLSGTTATPGVQRAGPEGPA